MIRDYSFTTLKFNHAIVFSYSEFTKFLALAESGYPKWK